MPFQDLIRSGNEQGLLRGDWQQGWPEFEWRCRSMRHLVGNLAYQVGRTGAVVASLDEALPDRVQRW